VDIAIVNILNEHMKGLVAVIVIVFLVGVGCNPRPPAKKTVINESVGLYVPSNDVNTQFEYPGITKTFFGEQLEYESDIRQASAWILYDEMSQKAIIDEVDAMIEEESGDEELFEDLFVNNGWVYYQDHGGDALSSCASFWPSGNYLVVVTGVKCNVEEDELWRAYVKEFPPSSTNYVVE